MTHSSTRMISVELSDEPRFTRRVHRLIAVSTFALGFILMLALMSDHGPSASRWGLLAGWILMPLLLLASTTMPRLRYLLAVPATLVGLATLAIALAAEMGAERIGWWLMTAGIWLGGGLGLWFWFRWLPVPDALDLPFSPGRWALIAAHVGLVTAGAVVVLAALLF